MNRHSSIYSLNDQLSLDDLRAYQANQLSGPARHRVERLLLENPFYADALDGLDALQQVGGSLKSQTHDLHLALQERVHESATPRRLMPLWVTSMVASVMLVLSVAVYLIFNNGAVQKEAVQVLPHQIEAGTILLNPNDLGTPEVAETAPKKAAVAVQSSQAKRANQSGNAVQKGHRMAAKKPVMVEAVAVPICGVSIPDMADEPLVLPRLETEVRDLRHVNTERAFLN